jgi:hypothetical protein
VNASTLTNFLSAFAYPVVKSAGFERKGREFRLVDEKGSQAYIGFYPDMLDESAGFAVIYGVAAPLHLEWLRDTGRAVRPWLGPSETLLRVQAYSPDWVDRWTTPDVDPYRWSFSDEQSAQAVGKLLADRLSDEVLPRLRSWFDPNNLAAAALTGDPAWMRRFMPPELTAAMALAQEGPSARIDELLAQAAERDRARTGDWIRERLRANRRGSTLPDESLLAAVPPTSGTTGVASFVQARSENDDGEPPVEVAVEDGVLNHGDPWPEDWGDGRSTDAYFLITPHGNSAVADAVLAAAGRIWDIDEQGREGPVQDDLGDVERSCPKHVAVFETPVGLYLYVDTEGELPAVQGRVMLDVLVQELSACGVPTRVGLPPADVEVGARIGP